MQLDTLPHTEMVTRSAAMAETYTREMYDYLISLIPPPERYQDLHSRLEANFKGSQKGDPEQTRAFESDRLAISRDISIILSLAKMGASKDPNSQMARGLGSIVEITATEKPQRTAVPLTTPQGFDIFFDRSGRINASVNKVAGAKAYEIWACDSDPNIDANWRLVVASGNCRGIVVSGLNRVKPNWLKVRAIRGNQNGPWSACLSLPAV